MAINRGIRRVDTGQSGCETSTLTRTALKGVSRDFKPNLNRGGIMEEKPRIGSRVIGTIKGVKGSCSAGHRVDDQIDLSGHDTGGLCGFLYHQAFPYILMLQFGGGFPPEWGDPDVVELDCMDKTNAVTLELRRTRD